MYHMMSYVFRMYCITYENKYILTHKNIIYLFKHTYGARKRVHLNKILCKRGIQLERYRHSSKASN